MAKEPEVPGQEDTRYGASFEEAHRQLSCGCWVAMDHTGACAVHGPMPSILRPGRIIEPAPFVPTWLDEKAAEFARKLMVEVPLDADPEKHAEAYEQAWKLVAKWAYDAAQALLDEGKKRREAKGD